MSRKRSTDGRGVDVAIEALGIQPTAVMDAQPAD